METAGMKPNKPYVLGLTGGIACGKSNVARLLRACGIPVLDADAISREATMPGGEALHAVREHFGDEVFDGDVLNRRRLGSIVFNDAGKRRELEEIIHPLVIARMERETKESDSAIVGWDVPLLYETGMDRCCDEVWCVHVSAREQLRRVMNRDKLSEDEARSRIMSQMPVEEKMRRADQLICTEGTFDETRNTVRAMLSALQRRLHID